MLDTTSVATRFMRNGVKVLVSVCLMAAPVAALAQADPNAAPPMMSAPGTQPMPMSGEHRMHHDKWMHDLMSLDLTDDQKSQIKTSMEQFHSAHTGTRPSKSDMKAFHEQIMAILTPAQRDELKAKMKEDRMMKPMMNKNMPNQMPTVAP